MPRDSALVTLALLVPLLGACATKGDVRNLRADLATMQLRQDSVLREIQVQNRLLLDSIRTTMALTVDVRGSTTNQLRTFEQGVQRQGELLNQIVGMLNRMDQRLTAIEQRPVSSSAPDAGGDVEQYYSAGVQMMNQQAYGTARGAFEEVVARFPQHPRAAEAQYMIGETYYRDEQFNEAYAALEKVAAQWKDSPRAAEALFRAGAIAEERRDIPRARRYYTRVRDEYGSSDAAQQAQQKLRSLPNR